METFEKYLSNATINTDVGRDINDTFNRESEIGIDDQKNAVAAAVGDHHDKKVELLLKPKASEKKLEPEEKPMLDPNHPLLEKFQKALREHLLKQIDTLEEEVFELETATKKKNESREVLGVEAYEVQQVVSQQQTFIEKYVTDMKALSEAHEKLETEVDEIYTDYKDKKGMLLESQQKEVELRNEVDAMNLLVHQMKKWEEEVNSELSINQRISEKTRKDKIRLAEEKREQDMYIYRLMTEVWKLESELETMDMQLRVKEEDREKLAETVAACNTDVEAFEAEYRCLMHSWNSVIVAITGRDKHYAQITEELRNLHEKVRSTQAEIDSTKKLCEKEMMRNERLTLIKSRIDNDIKMATSQMHDEKKKRDILERQLNSMQLVIQQTENDIKKSAQENGEKNAALNLAIHEFEKLTREKNNLEEQIFKKLEEQITNHKAAKHLNKTLNQLRDKNKDLEITYANADNKNAMVLMDTEMQKYVNEELQRVITDFNQQQSLMDAEILGYEKEFKKSVWMISKKQRDLDILRKKIENTMLLRGENEGTKTEIKIRALEKDIEDSQEKIRDLQKHWLREQGHVVSLSQQRQDQIYEFNLLKKQQLILEQKNLKISDELETYAKQQELIERHITNYHKKLEALCDTLSKKKGSKEDLYKSNTIAQNEFIGKLEDAELECLEIEEQIAEIEEEKIDLSNELIERNREALTWERKVQMAIETKQNMDVERGEGGEVTKMKNEIHRMQVRYSQLKRAQEKLVNDLEHCVMRRENIVLGAEAREKRTPGAVEKTRVNFMRKLEDTKKKLKQVKSERDGVQKLIDNEVRIEENLKVDKENTLMIQKVMDDKNGDILLAVEKVKWNKHLKLDLLVMKQRKLATYTELSKGRIPYTKYRNENTLNAELEKQSEINGKLSVVLDNLVKDFPEHYYELQSMSNTLKLPGFVMMP